MAKGDVKIERAFSKGFREISVVGVVQMIVEFKAHSKDGICLFIFSLPHFEQTLAKISTEIQCRPDLRGNLLVARFVQFLTKLPT